MGFRAAILYCSMVSTHGQVVVSRWRLEMEAGSSARLGRGGGGGGGGGGGRAR